MMSPAPEEKPRDVENEAASPPADPDSSAAVPEEGDAANQVVGEAVEQLFADAAKPVAERSLEDELAAAQNRVLRLQAELENVRKRSRRELEEQRRYAGLPLMRDLLAVVDNLQRAIAAAEQNHNASSLLEGVKMVAEQLGSVLMQHHCEPIVAEGAPFDPHLHEAIAQQPSTEHEPGTVSHVTQVGYRLHDRVVRPSQVIVASVGQRAPESEEGIAPEDEVGDAGTG